MSLLTTFFELIKPAKTDGVKVKDFNDNMDIIDQEMHRPPLTVNGVFPDTTTRNLYLSQVPLADNLSSEIAQVNNGTYIERTSGGSSSIEDGSANILTIKGGYVHTGYVPESIEWTLTPGEDSSISVAFDRDTFVAYVTESGTTVLTYTTGWSDDPTTYGFTVTGTPVFGDTITVVYVKEDRGLITVATPASFNSTGWNLYDNSEGVKRARVVAYSQQYGYRIGGTYTNIYFAPTLSAEQVAVTVTGGIFQVEEDGYIFVTGGNNTTYIYPTWTDWGSSYSGNFQTYTVDTIDLSEVMVNFPYGLMAINGVYDEININTQKAIQRTQRLEYTQENLTTVINSGVDYVCDTNYIYAVLEVPTPIDITLDGDYTVSDHGIEFFLGTSVPCTTEILYGEDLKDKLRTDVLTISQQTLSSAQKTQVQANLGLNIANNLTTTGAGYVLDARQGKTLDGRIGTLSSLTTSAKGSAVAAINELAGNRVQTKYLGAVSSSANKKVRCTTADCYMFIAVLGGGNNRVRLALARVRPSSTAAFADLGNGDNITFTADSSNGVVIANSSSNEARVYAIVFDGSIANVTFT